MSNLVRARRPEVRVIRASKEPIVTRVDQATWVPSGMHSAESTYATATFIPSGMHSDFRTVRGNSSIERELIAKGISPERARALVARAAGRVHHRRRHAGMGDADTDAAAANRLDTIMSDARTVQDSHKRMIANMASWEERTPGWVTTDNDLRLAFQDQLTGLKDQFVQRSLPTLGVQYPYQIDRVDPAGAIVLAVRDDIQNTVDLLDQRKAQQIVQKQISDLSKIPLPSGMPSFNFPSIDIPWYVWGAGIGVGALALKQMLK